jgi:hypothetical protein
MKLVKWLTFRQKTQCSVVYRRNFSILCQMFEFRAPPTIFADYGDTLIRQVKNAENKKAQLQLLHGPCP